MTWVILLLEGFGCGFWFARADHRRRHHASLRERLVWGRLPTTTLPVIDDRLRRAAGVPTRAQARVADTIVNTARAITRTRAFELFVLKTVRERWPIGRRMESKVHFD